MSPAAAQTTITGTVTDAGGTVLASGTIVFELSQEGTVSDPALLLIQPKVTCTITAGAIQAGCTLRGNDEISPAGTFYRVRIISSGGRTFLPERNYTITGATFDIGTATPLASDTIAAQAYQIVQDEGTNLPQERTLNFTGAGVACSDDSANARTNCSITGGGGGGSTHQVDGVNLTAQDPINLQDTAEIDVTNPSAGNLQFALKAGSVADSKLAANYSGIGSCGASNFVTGVNDNAAPTCAQPAFSNLSGTATDPQIPNTITIDNLTQVTTRNYSDLQNRVHGAADHSGDVIPAANQNFGAFYSDFGEIAAPANPAAGVVRVYAKTGSGELCSRDSAGTENCMSTGSGGANHNLLSATHSDTTTATVARGDLVVGQTAAPSWQRLAIGVADRVLTSDGTDANWGQVTDAALANNYGGVGSCGANQFQTADNDNAAPTCTQPAFSNLSGSAIDGQLPDDITIATQDNKFSLKDDIDNTKVLQFQLSSIATATTRTATWPDANGEVSLLGQIIEDAELASNYSGVGSCTNQFARALNDNAAPTCATVDLANDVTGTLADGNIAVSITRDSEWPSATATLTEKTLDVEATGNAVTTVPLEEFPAATCIGGAATLNWDDSPSLTEPAAACVTGTNITYGVADFDAAADEGMQISFFLPTGWTGNIDFDFYWHAAATTGSVVWALQTACVAVGEALDPAFNAAQTVTDAAQATANQLNSATISNITMTGCAASERLFLQLFRDADNVSDDMGGDARLVSTRLTLRRTQ